MQGMRAAITAHRLSDFASAFFARYGRAT